ncbi:MAG: translation elongation factor-like protein [Candidatus Jorgensenbacteria bacterium]
MGLFSWGSKKEAKKEAKEVVNEDRIGVVTHYFGGISVAIVKFSRAVKVGEKVHFKGATTDFEEAIKSMQLNHEDIAEAKKNQEVGIKVDGKVREGDEVYVAG